MSLTSIFAIGIGVGLIIGFIREKFIEHKVNKQNLNLYIIGYETAIKRAAKEFENYSSSEELIKDLVKFFEDEIARYSHGNDND